LQRGLPTAVRLGYHRSPLMNFEEKKAWCGEYPKTPPQDFVGAKEVPWNPRIKKLKLRMLFGFLVAPLNINI